MNYIYYLGSKPLLRLGCSVYSSCRLFCCSLLWDGILDVVLLFCDRRFLINILVACQCCYLSWARTFFSCWEQFGSIEYFQKVAVKGHPWRLCQEWTRNCWALKLLAYQWNVSKFLLICFRSDSSFSWNYCNIFQNEFTLRICSPLVSVEIDRLELWGRCMLA